MDMTLDFDLSPTTGLVPKHSRRGAVFALRLLLGHPELRAAYMEDCETLVRLLGRRVVWPQKVLNALVRCLRNESGQEMPANVDSDIADLVACLKGRQAWSTYDITLSRIYAENPKLITCALEDNLAALNPKGVRKYPGNQNTRLLSKLLGFNPVEMRLLDFAELSTYEQFRNFLRSISGFAPGDAYGLVASCLDAPVSEVRAALRAGAPLRAYGFLRVDSTPNDLEDFIRLGESAQTLLVEEFATAEDMLRLILHSSPSPSLGVEDYPHLKREFSWLATYLERAAEGHLPGTNILFYGAPGTGKSEFARLLAAKTGMKAFDIKSANNEGDPVAGKTRLTHFALSQRFLAESKHSLIIFDEIEDVFPDYGFSLSGLFGHGRSTSRGEQSKAWFNHQLENSSVPAIWISNSIDGIDEAFLRRFAFHVEFRSPPKGVRERILRRNLGKLTLSDHLISGLAMDDTLSPAQVSYAARFATLCSQDGNGSESAFLQALKASQAAMGRALATASPLATATDCNFRYLNLDTEFPIEKIEASLRRLPSATLCFHGVPGAGKTSLARHLADAVDRPLLVRRASDLLGMYVGETEKRIARMFSDAVQEEAVLLLDEADSFLRSRGQAQRSWEVTQVNELLQQMEAFDGIFICTTNLMADIDEAAMRRFTFKVRFDALTLSQREALFVEMVLGGVDTLMEPGLYKALQRLEGLTPGDFATVRRQQEMIGENYTGDQFLQQLEREWALKPGHHAAKIGFLGC